MRPTYFLYLCKARQFYLSMGNLCNWFKNWLVKTSGQSIQILAQHNNKPLIIRDGSLITGGRAGVNEKLDAKILLPPS